jgi:FixJ family two-component response regulator
MGSRQRNSGAVVHVVDDDQAVRTALARLLQAAGHEVRMYASAGEFLLGEPGDLPGCAIFDVRMPGPNGIELHKAMTEREAPLPVVFLTGHGNIPMSVQAIKAGAVDFLTKPVQREDLLAAVEAALARDRERRTRRAEHSALRARYETLTPRQRQVFARVVTGQLNKQVAVDIGAAERTVKAHRAHVMAKMHARSLAELCHLAERLGREFWQQPTTTSRD